MEDLLQFVPEEKHDDFKKATETLLSGYVKNDEESLINTVKANQAIFDKITAGPMDSRLNNWKEKELPKLLKEEQEKIRKELSPKPETETEKKMRKLTEKLEAKEQKEAEYERRAALEDKYKEVEPQIAGQMYLLEDTAIDAVMKTIGDLKKENEELKKVVKYGSKPPAGGNGNTTTISRADFNKLPASAQQEAGLKAAKGELIITD
jgi:hypothetical protein